MNLKFKRKNRDWYVKINFIKLRLGKNSYCKVCAEKPICVRYGKTKITFRRIYNVYKLPFMFKIWLSEKVFQSVLTRWRSLVKRISQSENALRSAYL